MRPPTPGKRTGRPRSTDADRAILDAARAALVELGWSGLSMGDVAARAGVAKTTVYRRWANKSDLVVDAVTALLDDQLELPDLGSLRADIEGVVQHFAALLGHPEAKTGLMAIIAEATRDDALRSRIRHAIVDRQKRLVIEGRTRAQHRGELPPDNGAHPGPQVDLIFDTIAGAVVHRTLVSGEPIDAAWAHRFTELLLDGLLAFPGTAGPGMPSPPSVRGADPSSNAGRA
ncbi:TetR/AcrR family transcriptional regulator [Actinacidiphila oryziradicis]|uniref:TetR/AcrR family transcriptional regulator n=1 Tax=Actinacidiphila oryziradicis TaxID=2571141 RepID=A0A4U0SJ64_9ACTN|nr:TetR/AcrR family transcriptional regulator [Actinacidiphila oryziradicis]TKA09642.1 TetR/AcrR family transcriptional regulator [Actinacidiphila oryziradicis]